MRDYTTNPMTPEEAQARYAQRLERFANGEFPSRHNSILGTFRLGYAAGYEREKIEADIVDNWPGCDRDPRPDELAEAGRKVFGQDGDYEPVRVKKWYPPNRDYVADGVAAGKGATSADLMRISPVPVKDLSPVEQACAYVKTVFNGPGMICALESYDQIRSQDTLYYPHELIARVQDGWFPRSVLTNTFTGVPKDIGKAVMRRDGTVDLSPCRKFANLKCLASFTRTLVEYDELPLQAQAEFWFHEIQEGLYKPLALTFSGHRSIHAILPMDAYPFDPGRRVELGEKGYEELRQEAENYFRDNRDRLEADLASAADPQFRADEATSDPTRLSRFPGGVNMEYGRRQRLLYLAK